MKIAEAKNLQKINEKSKTVLKMMSIWADTKLATLTWDDTSAEEYFAIRKRAYAKLKRELQKKYPDFEEMYVAFESNQDKIRLMSTYNISEERADKAIAKAQKIAQDFRGNTKYSMGEMIRIWINNTYIDGYDNTCEYSGRYAGKAVHGAINITFKTMKELESIEKIEGIWTIPLKNGKAKWIEENGLKKGGYKIYFVDGFLYGKTHSKKSFLDAKHIEKKKEIAALKKQKDIKPYMQRFIGVQNLRAVGACDAGIQNAARSIGLDLEKIGGIRIDEALRLSGNSELFMRYIKNVVANNFKI